MWAHETQQIEREKYCGSGSVGALSLAPIGVLIPCPCPGIALSTIVPAIRHSSALVLIGDLDAFESAGSGAMDVTDKVKPVG